MTIFELLDTQTQNGQRAQSLTISSPDLVKKQVYKLESEEDCGHITGPFCILKHFHQKLILQWNRQFSFPKLRNILAAGMLFKEHRVKCLIISFHSFMEKLN